MKKLSLILVVILIVLGSLGLSACASQVAAQRVLQNFSPWLGAGDLVGKDITETSVYFVRRQMDNDRYLDGIYTVTVRSAIDATVTVGDTPVEHYTGYYLNAEMKMNNGDTLLSQATFARDMSFSRSYFKKRETAQDGTVTITVQSAENSEKQLKTEFKQTDAAGKELKSCSAQLKHKKFTDDPHTDGAMVYLIARCLDAETASGITVKAPTYENETYQSIAIAMTAEIANVALVDKTGQELTRPGETPDTTVPLDYACRKITVQSTATFPGKSQAFECWIAEGGIETVAVKPILKITEGSMTYRLISAQKELTAA